MKILRGPTPGACSWGNEQTCKLCGTKVLLSVEDVRYATSYDYTGSCDVSYDWGCPSCGNYQDLDKVPMAIRDRARTAWLQNGEKMVDTIQLAKRTGYTD